MKKLFTLSLVDFTTIPNPVQFFTPHPNRKFFLPKFPLPVAFLNMVNESFRLALKWRVKKMTGSLRFNFVPQFVCLLRSKKTSTNRLTWESYPKFNFSPFTQSSLYIRPIPSSVRGYLTICTLIHWYFFSRCRNYKCPNWLRRDFSLFDYFSTKKRHASKKPLQLFKGDFLGI